MQAELTRAAATKPAHDQFQTVVFLLVLPALNLAFISTLMMDLGVASATNLGTAALRLWITFSGAYVLLKILGRYWQWLVDDEHFVRQVLCHAAIIVIVNSAAGLILPAPLEGERTGSLIMPRAFLLLEVMVYLAVRRLLRQQQVAHATAMQLKEAELAVLRMQSNPHFLFNTLNLLTAEIKDDPENAREIVFDLADLLRSTIKVAKTPLISLQEEFRLATLYLNLQQKRFKDRLTFAVSLDPVASAVRIPSLLLQPIIENAVKWAIAPYANAGHIEVSATAENNRLRLTVTDSGPCIETEALTEGNGFRILRETLTLTYANDYTLEFLSTENGGQVALDIPQTPTGHLDD